MKIFHFEARLWLPRPRNEVFEFFSNAINLEELTPSSLRFHVLTPTPIRVQQDLEIDYRLKIRGIPVRWRSKITVWDPPNRFVDEQVRGPYRLWIHEHRFTEQEGGTICEDSLQYAPLGGTLINKLFVAREVSQIFAYRSQRLQHLFPNELAPPSF
ncbi:MAG: SRPBCC family protein [Candidatus Acidiferrum sp.]